MFRRTAFDHCIHHLARAHVIHPAVGLHSFGHLPQAAPLLLQHFRRARISTAYDTTDPEGRVAVNRSRERVDASTR